jgi:hypothetical protein
MRTLIENRLLLPLAVSCSIGIVPFRRFPFPDEHPLLELVLLHKPHIFWAVRNAYVAMLFATPLIGASMLFSLLYIFVVRQQQSVSCNRLRRYPDPRFRQSVFLVIGELYNPKKPEPTEHPRWLTIPDRGLYTGIVVFGAIGSGKTSCCMYPFAEQIFAYRSADRERS